MNPKVYLAGPIRGLNYGEAVDWRDNVSAKLAESNIDAMSPMRAKRYLQGLSNVGGDKLVDAYAQFPLSTMKAIVTRDRHDCMKCDMVLMNLKGAKTVSMGSVIEIGWADAARVPIVLVMDKNNVHEHGMIREMCGFQTESLDEAVDIIRAVLLK